VSDLEEVLQILNPMTSTIFWSIVVFVILVVVLWRFVLKPIDNTIKRRQEEIRENIDSADRQNQEAGKYLEEQKANIEKSRTEAKKIINEGRDAAQRIKEEIEAKAGEKSRAIIEDALAEIRIEKERSLNQVRDEIVDIALAASEKIVSRKLSEKEHKKLIEDSLKEIGKV
jgi:F-type H+-transporting ATPase subunit b